MSHSPLVSVIIPFYNQSKFVAETVKSVLAQTFQDFEIIIVNDGSTENKARVTLEKVQNLDSRVIILDQENKGLAKSRNNGVRKAKGKYILPLDSDDTIEPTMLEKCFWLLESNPEIKIAYTGVRFFGEVNTLCSFVDYSFDLLLRENFLTATSMYEKKCWEEVGGYDETMSRGYEDWDFWIKFGKRGYFGKQIQEYLFNYRQHDISMRLKAEKEHGEIVKGIRTRHQETYFKSNLNIFFTLKRLLQKIYYAIVDIAPKSLKKPIKKIYLKLKFAGLLEYKVWLRHPVKSLLRCLPYSFRKKVNKLLGKQIFNLNYLAGLQLEKLSKEDCYNFNELEYSVKKYSQGLNILVIHPWMVVGGAEKVLAELFRYSQQDEVKYHLITTLFSQNPWFEEFTGLTDAVFSLPHFLKEKDYFNFISNYINNRNIDLVMISSSEYGYRVLPEIKKIFPKLPIIDLLHIEAPDEPMDYFRLAVKYRKFMDKRIVITEYLKNAQLEKYKETKERVEVIHNGVDASSKFNPQKVKESQSLYRELDIEKNKKIITFLGRFSEQKQPLQVLEIAKKMSCREDVEFVLIGEGGLKDSMDSFIRKNKLKKVHLIDSRTDVPEVFNSSSILLFPSKREGLPMVGIEAMSMGKPVIASRVEGWIDLIKPNTDGMLVEYGDIDAYVSAIETILDNSSIRKSIEVNARKKIIKNYDIIDTCKKYVQMFKELAGEKEEKNEKSKS